MPARGNVNPFLESHKDITDRQNLKTADFNKEYFGISYPPASSVQFRTYFRAHKMLISQNLF